MTYPRTRIAPPFIFEACTVQTQLGSELKKKGQHLGLLMLKRMCLINQVNAWSQGMHQNYQALLGNLTRFEQAYGLTLLQPTLLAHPLDTRPSGSCGPSNTIYSGLQVWGTPKARNASASARRMHCGVPLPSTTYGTSNWRTQNGPYETHGLGRCT